MTSNSATNSGRRRITSGRLGLVCGVLALVVSTGGVGEAARLIHGKKLVNNSVTGKKVKNNTLTGKDVKEKSLKGMMRAKDVQAWGAATDSVIDDFTSGPFTPVVSKTFTAPSSGLLYVSGAISAQDDDSLAGEGSLVYRLRLDGTSLTSDGYAHMFGYPTASSIDAASGAATGVVPVTKGQHTIHLDASEFGTGSYIQGREVSALFVRSGSGFTPPAKIHARRPANR